MTHHVLKNPEYDYASKLNAHSLAAVTKHVVGTLNAVLGPPHFLDAGPTSWQNVIFRILHPEIPEGIWGTGEEVVVPVPWDVIRVAGDLMDGKFPAYLAVEVKEKPDEGIDYLRGLLGPPPGEN